MWLHTRDYQASSNKLEIYITTFYDMRCYSRKNPVMSCADIETEGGSASCHLQILSRIGVFHQYSKQIVKAIWSISKLSTLDN